MDYKVILGVISIILALISFVPYLLDLIRNKTKPHIFSWLIWTLLMAIGFFAQMNNTQLAFNFVESLISGCFFALLFIKGKNLLIPAISHGIINGLKISMFTSQQQIGRAHV